MVLDTLDNGRPIHRLCRKIDNLIIRLELNRYI